MEQRLPEPGQIHGEVGELSPGVLARFVRNLQSSDVNAPSSKWSLRTLGWSPTLALSILILGIGMIYLERKLNYKDFGGKIVTFYFVF